MWYNIEWLGIGEFAVVKLLTSIKAQKIKIII